MTRYHPDDDGGEREWDMLDEKRFTCCGGREVHRIGCDFEDEDPPEDEDGLAADPDDVEDEDTDE